LKPLKLKLTAFGPYKDTETIDFTNLKDHHLFVISGATGAGKTTIFDGICFALYGAASGTDRDNSIMLRSHFADDDTHTAVELTFELNGRSYRVLRQLGHVKKGNKSKTGDKYEFVEQLEDGIEVPRVDRQIVSEINEKLEAIIGLTQDQFKQIVMLPQGEFRKLLTSETENKEQILRKLFKTERYKAMNSILKTKKEDVNNRFLSEKQMLEHHIQSIRTAIERRENSPLFMLLDQEFYNVEQILSGLQEEIIYLQTEITENEKSYTRALKQFEQEQTHLHEAISVNKQFASLADKKRDLEQLNAQKLLFTEKENQVTMAERALQLEPYERQLVERRQECKEQERYVHKAVEQFENAKTKYTQVHQAYLEEEKRETERDKLKRDVERFTQFLPTVKAIDETKQTLEILTKTITSLTNDLSEITTSITTKEQETENLKKAILEKEAKISERTKKQEERHQLRTQYKVFDNYLKLRKQYEQVAAKLTENERIFKQADTYYQTCEASWIQNQAAIMASHMHDGDACPVCGSTSHPEKAGFGTDAISKEVLDKAKADLEKKRDIYQSVLVDYRSLNNQLKNQAEEVAHYDVALENLAEETNIILKHGKKLNHEITELDKLADKITSNKTEREKLETDIKQARVKKEQFEKELSENQTEFNRLDATFQERLRQIPEDIQDLRSLQTKITETETVKNNLEKQWKKIQEQLQQTDKDKTTAELNVENGKKELVKLSNIVAKMETDFTRKLIDASFETEQLYKQAKLSAEARENLEQQIEQYKQQIITLNKQIEELTAELTGKEKANIGKLEKKVNDLKIAYESAFERLNASKQTKTKAMTIKESIGNVQSTIASLEKELAVISDLYDVLRGQNMKKISFERYLQIDYLDQITAAANERFKTLTNGQFYLIRSNRQETHGRQSGLAIDVYDAYTGQTRDVKTLSGGEKFIASLCLALGMSDVIQSFQGSIRVDTMFIDEGFGSLDEESLHKSIDALISLQQTGRMIGVISHVEELKTIFPAMLEVTKTKEGYSKTRFLLK